MDGVVSLMLGANDGGGQAPLPAGVFTTGAARELVLTVGGEELAAIPLGTTGYAFHAATADVALAAGGLGPDTVNTAAIQNGAVTAAKLADGAVASAKLADGAVTAAKLAAGAVGSAAIADGAVTSAKIVDGTVTAADIQPALLSSLDGVANDGGNIDLVAGTTSPSPPTTRRTRSPSPPRAAAAA